MIYGWFRETKEYKSGKETENGIKVIGKENREQGFFSGNGEYFFFYYMFVAYEKKKKAHFLGV